MTQWLIPFFENNGCFGSPIFEIVSSLKKAFRSFGYGRFFNFDSALKSRIPKHSLFSKKGIISYPTTRLRRNRSSSWQRRLVTETLLSVDSLVWPLFIREDSIAADIAAMPGVQRYSLKEVLKAAEQAVSLEIPAIMLFPVMDPSKKTLHGQESYNEDNLINKAITLIKSTFPDLGIMCDVALDPYTSHGQDGLLEEGRILNDETLDILGKQAVSLAQAGVDVVAPSDMMDGRVGHIRHALDEKGHKDVAILAYSAKYASSFYGPFREAVQSASFLGAADKKTYQMSFANTEEALRETFLDIQEGADMVLVKPGLLYLDVIQRIKDTFQMPTVTYHTSGEYAMLKAAAQNKWLEYDACLLESLMAFRRAGANSIITYGALEAARLLKEMKGVYNGS